MTDYIKTFRIKKGDTAPPIAVQILKESDNLPLDISSSSVTFSMYRTVDSSTLKVPASAGSIVSGPLGQVQYSWAAGDTDTPGKYDAEFTVTLPSGKIATFPSEGYILVEVLDKVGV